MRVISQDKRMDIQYESAALHIFNFKDEYEIGAYSLSTIDDGEAYLRMAKYTTLEKAIKAMEMCRDKYLTRIELDGGYDIASGWYVQPDYWVLPKVFHFPKDEEVEV